LGGFLFVVLVGLLHRASPTDLDLLLLVWSLVAAIVIAIFGAGVARAGLTGQRLGAGLIEVAGRWRQVTWVEVVVLAVSLALLFVFAPVAGAMGQGVAGEVILFALLALIEFVELPAIYLAATGTAGFRSLPLALELLRAGVLGWPLAGLIAARIALTVPLIVLRGTDAELLAVAGLAVVLILALLWCGAAIETARGSQDRVE
jgi:hypothetical protein